MSGGRKREPQRERERERQRQRQRRRERGQGAEVIWLEIDVSTALSVRSHECEHM